MKLYDISQEIFGCEVYPGDPAPEKETLLKTEAGDVCNLTSFRMCAHNGTHVDAPYHFYGDGKTISEMGLESFIGMAYVAEHDGVVTAEDASGMLKKAADADRESAKRILIKGQAVVSAEAARVFADASLLLLGNESQTFGPEDAPMEVHLILLGAEMVLLEGIRLGEVEEGVYFLNAAPIHLGDGDGAPCRAVLLDWKGEMSDEENRS